MKTVQFIFLFLLAAMFWQCSKEDSPDLKHNSLEITLKNTEVYRHDFNISGDEEGAVITQQANHSIRSEIVRNKTTDWSVVYVYQPENSFIGLDSVEIETCTGGDGTPNSCNTETVKFKFLVVN
jgi:hypothetical protein